MDVFAQCVRICIYYIYSKRYKSKRRFNKGRMYKLDANTFSFGLWL